MLRTILITAVLAGALLAVIILLTFLGDSGTQTQYLKFALSLLMFAVILVGSYWFVVRGPGRHM